MIKVIETHMTDCLDLSKNLREQDEVEISLSNGYSPLQAITLSFTMSQECHTIMYNDAPVGMFGVVDSGMFAAPWLLASKEIEQFPVTFIKECTKWVDSMNDKHPLLINYVHKENTAAIKWLKYLGFRFTKLYEHYGVGQAPFYQFVRIKECATQFTQ